MKGGILIVKFPNLRAEMARHGIRVGDVAKTLGLSYSAAYKKITGHSEFTLSELVIIRKKFFPDKTLDYLFEETA